MVLRTEGFATEVPVTEIRPFPPDDESKPDAFTVPDAQVVVPETDHVTVELQTLEGDNTAPNCKLPLFTLMVAFPPLAVTTKELTSLHCPVMVINVEPVTEGVLVEVAITLTMPLPEAVNIPVVGLMVAFLLESRWF
jgi:hypothetical protein